MEKGIELLRLLQYLQDEGIRATNDFVRDIKNLIKTDIEKFVGQFYKDFARKDFENYNRFKKLKLTKKQSSIIENNILWRYEYRNTSNFRCIFITIEDNNSNTPILLCAFNENGGKKNGAGSYNHNIERAIKIFQNDCLCKEEENES